MYILIHFVIGGDGVAGSQGKQVREGKWEGGRGGENEK